MFQAKNFFEKKLMEKGFWKLILNFNLPHKYRYKNQYIPENWYKISNNFLYRFLSI